MKNIAIIGAGKVGTALGVLLSRSGWILTGCAVRSEQAKANAERYLPCPVSYEAEMAIKGADIILLTVQDREIANVCDRLAAGGSIQAGVVILHTSGSKDLLSLQSAAEAGAYIGSMHPIQTFPDVESAIEHLPGSWYGVTASGEARETISDMIVSLGGKPIDVADELRPIYHIASVAACNFIVACMDFAISEFVKLGVDEKTAFEVLRPLIMSTLENIAEKGVVESLTGPVERGDFQIIEDHLAALGAYGADDVRFYKAVSERIGEVALRKGSISASQLEDLKQILREERHG